MCYYNNVYKTLNNLRINSNIIFAICSQIGSQIKVFEVAKERPTETKVDYSLVLYYNLRYNMHMLPYCMYCATLSMSMGELYAYLLSAIGILTMRSVN